MYILVLFTYLTAFILTGALLTVPFIMSFLETPPAAILEYAEIVSMVSGICLIVSAFLFFGMLLVETIKEYK